MIRPIDNERAVGLYAALRAFLSFNRLLRSPSSRKCYALVCADRYLAKCDEGECE